MFQRIKLGAPAPRMFHTLGAKAAYNALIAGIEKLAPFVSMSSVAGLLAGNPVADRPLLRDLKATIDRAPLYLLEPEAAARSLQAAKDRFERVKFSLPTIPDCGATVVDDDSAVYVCLDPVAEEKYKNILDGYSFKRRNPTVVRFVSAEAVSEGNVSGVFYGNMLLSEAEDGTTDMLILNLDVCFVQGPTRIVMTMFLTDDGMRGTMARFHSETSVPQVETLPAEAHRALCEETSRGVKTALEQLEYIDMPCHYVVEERPDHVAPDRRPGVKGARFDDRERWLTLTPEAVKVKFAARTDIEHGTHASPAPHLRRAHDRVLRSERYTLKRGTTVHVRPTWVGDREWANRGLRYRVIARPGSSETQA